MALCPHVELQLTAAGRGTGQLRGDLVRDRPKVRAALGTGRDSAHMWALSGWGVSSPSSLSPPRVPAQKASKQPLHMFDSS